MGQCARRHRAVLLIDPPVNTCARSAALAQDAYPQWAPSVACNDLCAPACLPTAGGDAGGLEHALQARAGHAWAAHCCHLCW